MRAEHCEKGVLAALFTACVRIARESDCGHMQWSALDWNPACKFYERFDARTLKTSLALKHLAQESDGPLILRMVEYILRSSFFHYHAIIHE